MSEPMHTGLTPRVANNTRQRCACCGADRIAPETRIIVDGDAYCVPCERAIRVAPHMELTPEAKAFVARLAARNAVPTATQRADP
jgi:hypothetical protein